jgi:preprotein translocase subunit SecB
VQLSPLQLLEFAFEEVSIKTVLGFEGKRHEPGFVTAPGDVRMRADTGIALLAEHAKYSDFGLKLLLSVEPKDPNSAPYEATVGVRGTFRMHQMADMKDGDERRKRALVNGVSILYGLVRDMVCTVSSRSSHGQMLLPTLNFASLADHSPEALERAAASPPAAQRRKTRTKAAEAERK